MKCDIMKLITFFFLFPGNALVKTGQTQTNIGNAEKEFVQSKSVERFDHMMFVCRFQVSR
jgi:hypothetical protein